MRFLLVPGFCLSVTIASYSQCNIQLSVVQVNVTCFGASSGSIDLNLTGAVAPYSCYWSNGETTEDLKNLSAGIYSVLVIDASLCTAEGSFTITQPFQPLSIISHPLPQTDCYGNQVVFSAGITGAEGTVVYQWQQKPPGDIFSDITGANNALLIIDNIGMNNKNINGTEYRIMITDDCGSIISYPALLSINTITGLTPADVNSILCNGGNKTYAVSALGTIESYQWFIKNGTNWDALSDAGAWSGTTTSELTISNATIAQNGSYRVSVTFKTLNQPPGYLTCVETSSTRERNLLVRAPFLPTVISENQQICIGEIPAQLNATPASGGSGPLYSYQWQSSPEGISWTDINGETTLSYSPPVPSSTAYYRIVTTDMGTPACGTVISAPVILTVNPLPSTSAIYHQ